MYRYQTADPSFHQWTRMERFSSHAGMGGQWFMKLPPTVSGAAPPPGTPTHILTSGDGGAFAFGDYHESNDSFVPAPAEWAVSVTESGPDSGWMATQYAGGRLMNIGWAMVCGGASALTSLREIKYDPRTKSLVANPVPELAGLRGALLSQLGAPIQIAAGQATELAGTSGVDAAASSDVEVLFALPADGSPAVFGVCVLAGAPSHPGGAIGGPWRPDGRCGDSKNSSGIVVLANLSAVDPQSGERTGTVSIGQRSTVKGHPRAIKMYKGEDDFDMRILVDRCIVEAFVMGGRAAFTSMGPTEGVGKGAVAKVPGTAVVLIGHTAITTKAAAVHAVGCGWTDPPYMGSGPFSVKGRMVPTGLY